MDKQDKLASMICAARIGVELPEDADIEPSDDDLRIAAAVRSFMGSPEAVERACAAGADFNGFAWPDDYDGHQREMIRATNRTALSAAIGEDIGGGRG